MFMPVLAVIYGGINALKNKLALLSGILCIGLVIAFIFYTGKDNQKKGGIRRPDLPWELQLRYRSIRIRADRMRMQ